jgi:motility quorum-sensing regulator/GCU-specific mRNA interferase toxin
MEKRTPHYSLAEIQAIVAERGALAFTRTAIENGHAMGLIVQEMVEVVCSMTMANFYKSMTTYHDHTAWQDVYHAMTPVGSTAYIKVSDPRGRGPVIQFKEK